MIASIHTLPLCFGAGSDSGTDTLLAACIGWKNRITENTAISGQSKKYHLSSHSCSATGPPLERLGQSYI